MTTTTAKKCSILTDRVVPMHSLEPAAAVQHAAGGSSLQPLLVRIENPGRPWPGKAKTSKLIDESADIFAFLHHLKARSDPSYISPSKSPTMLPSVSLNQAPLVPSGMVKMPSTVFISP